jgi:rhodanese-related sulfurtransferase
METIKKKEYHNEGVFINLDTSFNPYQNLLNNHYKYLDKNKTYYFYCKKGFKSKKVASILEAYGYKVFRVIE